MFLKEPKGLISPLFSSKEELGGTIPPQISFESNTLKTYSLFKATTTRWATSTPVSLVGAKKVTFQFARTSTTTTGTSTFYVYVSGREPVEKNFDYIPVMQVKNVAGNTLFYASSTAIAYKLDNNGTTTVSVDLTRGTYSSAICLVNRVTWGLSTCNVWIER